jgi:hypothetical protein
MSVTAAQLQARADGGQFQLLQVVGTTQLSGPTFVSVFGSPTYIQVIHPLQTLFRSATPSRTAISWTSVYRTWRLSGSILVVDSSIAASCVQLVLNDAQNVMDGVDLRMNLFGYPPNGRRGPVGFPQTSPNAPPGTGGPFP